MAEAIIISIIDIYKRAGWPAPHFVEKLNGQEENLGKIVKFANSNMMFNYLHNYLPNLRKTLVNVLTNSLKFAIFHRLFYEFLKFCLSSGGETTPRTHLPGFNGQPLQWPLAFLVSGKDHGCHVSLNRDKVLLCYVLYYIKLVFQDI